MMAERKRRENEGRRKRGKFLILPCLVRRCQRSQSPFLDGGGGGGGAFWLI